MRPKLSSAEPGGGPYLLARSKCVIPRSNARRRIARCVSSGRSSPKLFHRPREIVGSCSPLRPTRRKAVLSYRFSRGVQVTKGSLPRGPVTCAGRRPSPGSSAAVLGQPKVPVGPGFASLACVGDQVGAGRRLGGRHGITARSAAQRPVVAHDRRPFRATTPLVTSGSQPRPSVLPVVMAELTAASPGRLPVGGCGAPGQG